MNFNQKRFDKELQRQIKQYQKELKELSDDELMLAHEHIYDVPEQKRDAAYMAAILNEVNIRSATASNTGEHEKWLKHNEKTEHKATQEIIDIFSQYSDPKSQEVVRRLKQQLNQ